MKLRISEKSGAYLSPHPQIHSPACGGLSMTIVGTKVDKESNDMRQYYVYIMTNHSRTLYTGMTNNLLLRVYQHKIKKVASFTQRYNVNKLVYYETTSDVRVAIAREKEIKGWVRRKKVALINSVNPAWEDLSLEWMDPPPCHSEDLRDEESDTTCHFEARRPKYFYR